MSLRATFDEHRDEVSRRIFGIMHTYSLSEFNIALSEVRKHSPEFQSLKDLLDEMAKSYKQLELIATNAQSRLMGSPFFFKIRYDEGCVHVNGETYPSRTLCLDSGGLETTEVDCTDSIQGQAEFSRYFSILIELIKTPNTSASSTERFISSLTQSLAETKGHIEVIQRTREEEKIARARKLDTGIKKETLQIPKGVTATSSTGISPAQCEAASAFLGEITKKDIILKGRRTAESILKAV